MNRLLLTWTTICAVVGAALAGSQLLEMPHRSALRGYDNTFNYLWLRSAVVDHDWDFRNDLEQCNTLTPEYRAAALALPRTPTDRVPNKYGIGWAVVTLPFYLVADTIVAFGRMLGWTTLARDGFNPVYQAWIQIGHVGLALLGLWLAVQAVTAWLGDRISATAGVVAVWAASPLLYYQTADVGMSHGAAFFAIASLAYSLSRADMRPDLRRWWMLAGAAAGLAVITRFQLAVFALPVVAAVWGRGGRGAGGGGAAAPEQGEGSREQEAGGTDGERWTVDGGTEQGEGSKEPFDRLRAGPFDRLRAGGTSNAQRRTSNAERPISAVSWVALGAVPFLLLQGWAWRVVYGRWLVFSYGGEGEAFHWTHPELLRSLVSPWHGLLYWHPFLIVGFVGLAAWAWARGRAATPWAIAVLFTLYVNAAWWCWWFASAFGSRSFDAALLPLMAGAGWLLTRGGRRVRAAWWTLAVVAGAWNFYVVLLYRSGAISRSEPVTWLQMLSAAARLPEAMRF